MSIYLYEESLINELRKITKDTRVNIVSPELTSSFLAQVGKDKNIYPAVLLTRNSAEIVKELTSLPTVLKGDTATVKDNLVQKAKFITVRVEWSLNVYAVDRFTCDEIIRELLFYFYTYPKFYVQIPYGLDIRQEFDVLLNPDITDNTDLNGFDDKGELFRETLTIWSDNVHLFSRGSQYIVNVESEVSEDLIRHKHKHK